MRYGLRPRLLASLFLVAAVTLGTAAVVLLGPLQDRLREDAAESLRAAVLATRPGIESNLFRLRPPDHADRLAERTDARVQVYDARAPDRDATAWPVEDYDTGTGTEPARRDVYEALRTRRTVTTVSDDEVRMVVLLHRGRGGPLIGAAAATKPLTDVAATVDQVRDAFLTAALIGLAVALLLGTGISSTLLRRLERLRQAAIANTPVPADDSRDEVGDLTRALAAMQESLNRQEAARRAFVATASHELRTPLTLLQGMLELLDDDLREGRVDLDDAHDQIVAAQRQLRRLEHLASDLLDLSRLDAEAPLRSEPVELGEMTRAVAAEFDLRAAERGVSVEVVPPIAPCWAKGDPGAVARIVRILLDNALRFAPPAQPVSVEAAYHGERATVEVSDRGPGVPPEERQLIFERFQRGSSTGGEEGFGLGLAIGRELAQRLGGQLELVEDDAVPGARFVLSLPIELPSGSRSREREPVA
jgi:signal transduction histidine kinase